MYQLKQIHDFENCEQIQALFSDLPKKPYCTNSKGFCHIRNKKEAIKHAYIQPNHPAVVRWLVFDLDYEQALFAYHDKELPRPQLIIKNPTNGHAHYCYKLSEKVGMWGNSSQKAINYLEAVSNALKRKLGADMGYSGNLIKNPAHSEWEAYITGAKKSYTLGELAEYLDLTEPTKHEPANDSHYGRNCSVFHATRRQAYAIAHKHDYNTLYYKVLAIASDQNAKFDEPMQPNEVRHIAKSIARYCTSAKFRAYSADWFSRLQASRVAIANAKSQACNKGGKARSESYNSQREQAKLLREKGLSMAKIAQQLGSHKTQIARWLK